MIVILHTLSNQDQTHSIPLLKNVKMTNLANYIVQETNAKSLIPIHTVHEDYFKKWHDGVVTVELNKTLTI